MKVLNIHRRIIYQPKSAVLTLLKTLSSKEDKVWPHEYWPRMKLDNGLEKGSKGGHGPIRYFINEYIEEEFIQFEFTKPLGFNGIHRLQLKSTGFDKTILTHTIEMNTSAKGTLKWVLFVRSLHDALIEDAFNKVENYFDHGSRKPQWSLWVRLCRKFLAPKNK